MAHGASNDVHFVDSGQPYMLLAMGEMARLAGDPDFKIIHRSKHCFRKGVRNGYDSKLHRTPAVYARKTRWRLYDKEELTESRMNNFEMVEANADAVMAKFQKEQELGRVDFLTMTEAENKFGSKLLIAAIFAEQKVGGDWRILHDATHGVESIQPLGWLTSMWCRAPQRRA